MKTDSLNNATSKVARGGVFPNEETFQKIYSECLENQPQAPKSLQNAYTKMTRAFENYLAEYDEAMFRYAYECGYKAAKEQKPEPVSNVPWYLLKSLERKAGAAV